MKLEKLSLKSFKKSALTFDSLKSILAGDIPTAEGGGPPDLSDYNASIYNPHDILSDSHEETWYPVRDLDGNVYQGEAYNDGCD